MLWWLYMILNLFLLLGVTIDDKKEKPQLVKVYDFSKGGTDVMDQRIGYVIVLY